MAIPFGVMKSSVSGSAGRLSLRLGKTLAHGTHLGYFMIPPVIPPSISRIPFRNLNLQLHPCPLRCARCARSLRARAVRRGLSVGAETPRDGAVQGHRGGGGRGAGAGGGREDDGAQGGLAAGLMAGCRTCRGSLRCVGDWNQGI